MPILLDDIIKNSTSCLEWRDSSRWAQPHPNDLYTSEVKVYGDEESWQVFLSFHVSDMKLVACRKSYDPSYGVETVFFDLGEFPEPIISSHSALQEACDNIKMYAQYVVDGYREFYSFRHCPSFERIDDVDEYFNPIY